MQRQPLIILAKQKLNWVSIIPLEIGLDAMIEWIGKFIHSEAQDII